MQPVVGLVLAGFGLSDRHLVVGRLGDWARCEEARDGVSSSRRDLFNLVHVFPSRRENHGGAPRGVVWGEFSAGPADFVLERSVVVLLAVAGGGNLGGRTVIVVLLLLCGGIVKDKAPPLEIDAVRAQIQNARVVVPVVGRLVGVENDKVSLPAPATLLGGPGHVLARVGLEGQDRPQIQPVFVRNGPADPLDQSHELQNGRSRHPLDIVEGKRRELGKGVEIGLGVACKGRKDVAAAGVAARPALAPAALGEGQILVVAVVENVIHLAGGPGQSRRVVGLHARHVGGLFLALQQQFQIGIKDFVEHARDGSRQRLVLGLATIDRVDDRPKGGLDRLVVHGNARILHHGLEGVDVHLANEGAHGQLLIGVVAVAVAVGRRALENQGCCCYCCFLLEIFELAE
mmetsp:Transcript_20355/g.47720  ORF Transcript_20355/g.47720 Transcript_20355/m.47720 type:complete len:402 (-) Transcript_20355:357-1562(-)